MSPEGKLQLLPFPTKAYAHPWSAADQSGYPDWLPLSLTESFNSTLERGSYLLKIILFLLTLEKETELPSAGPLQKLECIIPSQGEIWLHYRTHDNWLIRKGLQRADMLVQGHHE